MQSAGLKTDDVRAEKAFAEAQAAVKAERWNDALEGFTTAILYRQDYVEAHRARARVYLNKGRDAEAINDLNALLKSSPGDGEAWACAV